MDTLTSKSASFLQLVGNPSQGVEGGRMAQALRSLGSAALNFSMVAQGGMDMYWLAKSFHSTKCY
jgi:myo-inositol-1(or 4)-monophosphatase